MGRISVIGSGFSGLTAACALARYGHDVTVLEKNDTIGGRARVLREKGFTFDMGPSWYWMPDVFEQFFGRFGKSADQYYELVQLDPGFQMIFGKNDVLKVPARLDDIYATFEQVEKGSADNLKKYLAEARYKYEISMGDLVYKPCFSWREFMNMTVLKHLSRLSLLGSVSGHVRKYFRDERLVALMEFPSLFLGATAHRIPALYSLMNYASLTMGTWYPMGGMGQITEGMASLARKMGVEIHTGCEVTRLEVSGGYCRYVNTKQHRERVDGVIASGDYHAIEERLLEERFRNYDERYWQGRTFAPSCLIFYLGVGKRVKNLIHHNLFFDTSLQRHAGHIYDTPQWPDDPLFYVCCPSKTDVTVAPQGMENLFILMPIAPGLTDTADIREKYFHKLIKRLEDLCEESILPHIIYKKSYCVNDFVKDYYAYKGNAYGLANTLRQTAVLKPSLRNRKVKGLYYTGQLTVPGPGVPPALISGQIAARQLHNTLK
ncbi:phytoene desaturase family protein [Nemorincola caseinilytica]|uniref:Phytoene desaturase family protein n=1 Tax=Nemorincola caseinilytica TaxID=2054315 RepID=A0ABP8NRJ7_9BACT